MKTPEIRPRTLDLGVTALKPAERELVISVDSSSAMYRRADVDLLRARMMALQT